MDQGPNCVSGTTTSHHRHHASIHHPRAWPPNARLKPRADRGYSSSHPALIIPTPHNTERGSPKLCFVVPCCWDRTPNNQSVDRTPRASSCRAHENTDPFYDNTPHKFPHPHHNRHTVLTALGSKPQAPPGPTRHAAWAPLVPRNHTKKPFGERRHRIYSYQHLRLQLREPLAGAE